MRLFLRDALLALDARQIGMSHREIAALLDDTEGTHESEFRAKSSSGLAFATPSSAANNSVMASIANCSPEAGGRRTASAESPSPTFPTFPIVSHASSSRARE
jgi:hypothetical protein